jgi:hypothetical protein
MHWWFMLLMGHAMETRMILVSVLSLLAAACATDTSKEPSVRDLEPRPVLISDDPVNTLSETAVDGLVLILTIDGSAIHLESATLTRVPPTAARRGTGNGEDRVTAVGYAAGVRVSEASAPDQVLNVQEGVGIVRLTKRQVQLALPAPRALDTVQVEAPATGASARVDVRSAYAPYCKEYRADNKWCPSRGQPESLG